MNTQQNSIYSTIFRFFFRSSQHPCNGQLVVFVAMLCAVSAFLPAQSLQTSPEYLSAQQLTAQRSYEEAISALQPLLNNPECAAEARIEIGSIRMRQAESEYAASLSHFGEAAQNLAAGIEQGGISGPRRPNTLYDLGRIYGEKLFDYPKAIDTYRKILDEHPEFLAIDKVVFQLASSLEKMLQYNSAVEYYQYLLTSYPYSSYSQAAQERMTALAPGTKHAAAAIEIQEEILDAAAGEEEAAQAGLDLAAMQAEAGKYKQAIRTYEKLAQESSDPDVAREAMKRMAIIMDEKEKDYKGAAKMLETLVNENPDSQDAKENLFRLGRIYEQDVQDLKTRVVDGQVRYRKSTANFTKALDYYDKLTESDPNADVSADAFLRKGEIYQKQFNDVDEAKRQYNEFLRRFPTHPEAESIRQRLKDIDNAD